MALPLMGEGRGGGKMLRDFGQFPPLPNPSHQGRGRIQAESFLEVFTKHDTCYNPGVRHPLTSIMHHPYLYLVRTIS